jgi:GST-like protein
MTDAPAYTPPKVWTWTRRAEVASANTNRPIAGATQENELPVGRHPF